MAEFVYTIADDLVSGSIGGLFGSPVSGVSIQPGTRRELFGGDRGVTVVALIPTGGAAFSRDEKESYGFQAWVDSPTVSGASDTARLVFDRLHERTAEVLGGHQVLWIRAIAPPQAIPASPTAERFQFSVNFDSLLVKA